MKSTAQKPPHDSSKAECPSAELPEAGSEPDASLKKAAPDPPNVTTNKYANDGSFLKMFLSQVPAIEASSATGPTVTLSPPSSTTSGSHKRVRTTDSCDASAPTEDRGAWSTNAAKKTKVSQADAFRQGNNSKAPHSSDVDSRQPSKHSNKRVGGANSNSTTALDRGKATSQQQQQQHHYGGQANNDISHNEEENDEDEDEESAKAKEEFLRAMRIMEEAGLVTEKGIGAGMVK